MDNDSTNFLKHCFVVSCLFVHIRVCFQANPPLYRSSFGAAFAVACLMSGWVCQWKPFWIPVGDSFKKAFVEEWVFISGEPSDGQNTVEFPVLHSTDHSDYVPVKKFASLP